MRGGQKPCPVSAVHHPFLSPLSYLDTQAHSLSMQALRKRPRLSRHKSLSVDRLLNRCLWSASDSAALPTLPALQSATLLREGWDRDPRSPTYDDPDVRWYPAGDLLQPHCLPVVMAETAAPQRRGHTQSAIIWLGEFFLTVIYYNQPISMLPSPGG